MPLRVIIIIEYTNDNGTPVHFNRPFIRAKNNTRAGDHIHIQETEPSSAVRSHDTRVVVMAHLDDAFVAVDVDEGDGVQQLEDESGRQPSLCVVGQEGGRLTNGHSSEGYGEEDPAKMHVTIKKWKLYTK